MYFNKQNKYNQDHDNFFSGLPRISVNNENENEIFVWNVHRKCVKLNRKSLCVTYEYSFECNS